MYLINKGGTLKNLCLRGVYLSKKFSKTQNKQTLVYLRAPKHFNIGKQEIKLPLQHSTIFLLDKLTSSHFLQIK